MDEQTTPVVAGIPTSEPPSELIETSSENRDILSFGFDLKKYTVISVSLGVLVIFFVTIKT